MRKFVAKIVALAEGNASIESVGKTAVLKTPGDVTIPGHQ
jgi:hypothetical protein